MKHTWRSLRPGRVVAIDFQDHVVGGDSPIAARVYGRVHKVKPDHVTLDYWHPTETAETRVLEDNTECVTILRSAVIQIQVWAEIETAPQKPSEASSDQHG